MEKNFEKVEKRNFVKKENFDKVYSILLKYI